MTAPSATVRGTPGGIPLQNGSQTLLTIALDTDISFWEVELTPPAVDGGEPIDTTTQHNTLWGTMAPRRIMRLLPYSVQAAYDPDVYDEIAAIINTNTTITFTFPDGSTLAHFGFVRSFTPTGGMSDGGFPLADIVIVPSNWDSAGNVEAGPVMTEVAGT